AGDLRPRQHRDRVERVLFRSTRHGSRDAHHPRGHPGLLLLSKKKLVNSRLPTSNSQRTQLVEALWGVGYGKLTLFSQELPVDRVLADLHPIARAVLAEDLDARVDELLVL